MSPDWSGLFLEHGIENSNHLFMEGVLSSSTLTVSNFFVFVFESLQDFPVSSYFVIASCVFFLSCVLLHYQAGDGTTENRN